MPHGGRRPGAGRKTNAQINNVRSILGTTMTDAQWKHLFRRLHELALDGNMRAAALLLNYRFGDPRADPEREIVPIDIRTIEVRLADPKNRVSPGDTTGDDASADADDTDDDSAPYLTDYVPS